MAFNGDNVTSTGAAAPLQHSSSAPPTSVRPSVTCAREDRMEELHLAIHMERAARLRAEEAAFEAGHESAQLDDKTTSLGREIRSMRHELDDNSEGESDDSVKEHALRVVYTWLTGLSSRGVSLVADVGLSVGDLPRLALVSKALCCTVRADPHWLAVLGALDRSFPLPYGTRVEYDDHYTEKAEFEVSRSEAEALDSVDRPTEWRLREDPRWGGLGGAPGQTTVGTPTDRETWKSKPAFIRCKALALFLQKIVSHCRSAAERSVGEFPDWCGDWFDHSRRLAYLRRNHTQRYTLLMRICMLGMYEDYLHATDSIYNMEELLAKGDCWEPGGSSDGQEIAYRIPAHEDSFEPHEHGPAFAGSNAHIEQTLAKTEERTEDLTVELLGSKLYRSLRILPFSIEFWEEAPFVDRDPLRYEIKVPSRMPYSVRQAYGVESDQWTDEIKLKIAEDCKYKGTAAFCEGDISTAAMEYTKALAYINAGKSRSYHERESILCSIVRLNAAAAHLKLEEYQRALYHLHQLLGEDDSSQERWNAVGAQLGAGGLVKAMYRRGQAELGLGDLKAAKATLKRGVKLDSKNKPMLKLLKQVEAKLAQEKEKERRRGAKMMQVFG
jgi:tetratricopeptide (TPR) repeat protein